MWSWVIAEALPTITRGDPGRAPGCRSEVPGAQPGGLSFSDLVPEPPQAPTVQLLHRLDAGDAGAADELLPLVYDELHQLAQRMMTKERGHHTLQATALINEAFVRLAGPKAQAFESRRHFMGVAARAMRNVLIDHARRRSADKRGKAQQAVTLCDQVVMESGGPEELLTVHEGLEALAAQDPKLAQIVELRFFAGLSHPEIAEILETPLRSVERGWQFARAWLRRQFGQGEGPD